ncbi:MAG: DUF305 domain-containing protein [Labedaea sp.]
MIRLGCLILAGVVALVGCSSPAHPASSAPATNDNPAGFNAGDVMFLQMMVPHLEQGRAIAGLAATRGTSADVRTLAAAIDTTQADEVRTMSGWLRTWHQPASATANAHAEHGGMPNTTESEIATLGRISGAEFDRRFLNVMIAHQDDAIQLARMESATGTNPPATALARRIETSRAAQIEQMLGFLGQH